MGIQTTPWIKFCKALDFAVRCWLAITFVLLLVSFGSVILGLIASNPKVGAAGLVLLFWIGGITLALYCGVRLVSWGRTCWEKWDARVNLNTAVLEERRRAALK